MIKECVWNAAPKFHITGARNFSVDVMHDFYEGASQYVFGFIVFHFILVIKCFSVDDVNHSIKIFDYGPIDGRNKTPFVTIDQIKSKC